MTRTMWSAARGAGTQAGRVKLAAAGLLLMGLLCAASGETQAAERPPNVVLVFIDDMGYGDVGCYGNEKIRTPAIDRMAAEGMKFTSFYVNCPVCSGSRTALMTGCHFQRLGVAPVLFPNSKIGLNPAETTVAEVLKSKGYATACIGKWHLGHLPPFLPTKQGFDYYFGVPYSNDMWIDPQAKLAKDVKLFDGETVDSIRTGERRKNVVPLMVNDEVVEYPVDQALLTKRYTDEAIRFMTEHRDGPFFIYLPHSMCHVPLYATEPFKEKSQAGLFGAVIEELDDSMDRLLKSIKELGLDENTLVIFTSDNGAASGSSLPLRGKKATLYEGGVREPCIMRWPGKIPAGKVCAETAATIDVLPTLAKLAGAPLAADHKVDGHDVWPLMSGVEGAKTPHEFYCLSHGQGSVRSGDWKYYPWPEGINAAGKKPGKKQNKNKQNKQKQPAAQAANEPANDAAQKPPVQLYNLAADVAETRNVAAEHPEVVARLQKAFDDHQAYMKANQRPVGKAE